ncbi:DUF1824 family protein [Spirulina major CS-329]|uniref:DUF1824 family protein n=1 Tax=Spirulina TaxID=1154 RepID=UPI00232F2CC4|nr:MULTISPECIES: DUF1824 family protein [Spirulina]MDB9494801.1 DUF1824 family protein [Spirulina subsalsa CS-330]MDB9501637.1 DUF1824 family protein [Spirulina major CS-329]
MSPSLTAARQLLESYSCIEPKLPSSEADRQALQTALRQIVAEAESENFGICADNQKQGYQVLASYLTACGYTVPFDVDAIADPAPDPAYIKFSTATLKHYTDQYTGSYRGVLVSCQAEDDQINGTYGHLPLDLFTPL